MCVVSVTPELEVVELVRSALDQWHAVAFIYKLELADGTPAEPPSIRSAPGVTWRAGDTIPLGRHGALRVGDTRLDEGTYGDPVSVLVVEAA